MPYHTLMGPLPLSAPVPHILMPLTELIKAAEPFSHIFQ